MAPNSAVTFRIHPNLIQYMGPRQSTGERRHSIVKCGWPAHTQLLSMSRSGDQKPLYSMHAAFEGNNGV